MSSATSFQSPQLDCNHTRDKLHSYGVVKREVMPGVEHRQDQYLNNRAEVSHQPVRRRERQMQWFKSARQPQRFLFACGRIHNHFQLRRHRLSARGHQAARDGAFSTWREVAAVPVAQEDAAFGPPSLSTSPCCSGYAVSAPCAVWAMSI